MRGRCLLGVIGEVVGQGGVVNTPGVEPLELTVDIVVHGLCSILLLGPVDIGGLGSKSRQNANASKQAGFV